MKEGTEIQSCEEVVDDLAAFETLSVCQAYLQSKTNLRGGELAGFTLQAIDETRFRRVMALENSVLVHMKSGWEST